MSAPLRTAVLQPLPGIGDMIWYLPALKAIAASTPGGQITLITRASSQARTFLKFEPMIAGIVDVPGKARGLAKTIPNFFKTWLALVRTKPDRLFILHSSGRYLWAARLAGIRQIIAYPASLSLQKDDEWSKSRAFVEGQGITVANPYSSLTVDAAVVQNMRQKFAACPEPWIIIAPGASVLFRTWPADRFAFCADALLEEKGGTVFLIGSPKEAEHIALVQAQCRHGSKMISLAGLPLDQVMGVMASSLCLLGNDSGPANMMAALGRPAFSLCGTHIPVRHSPNLHFITPDLSETEAEGIKRISAQHALAEIKKILG